MTKRSSAREPTHPKPAVERRARRGKLGLLTWLKGLMGRPVALQSRDGKLHMTLVERRRSPAEFETQALQALRHELQTRLVAQNVEHAARVMRHLVFVHDELGRKGWAGVALMSGAVLGKALLQVEMMHSRENSLLLAGMVDKLRLLKAAAEVREEQQARRAVDPATGAVIGEVDVEISETTHEAFEETERSWVGTLPHGLARPESER